MYLQYLDTFLYLYLISYLLRVSDTIRCCLWCFLPPLPLDIPLVRPASSAQILPTSACVLFSQTDPSACGISPPRVHQILYVRGLGVWTFTNLDIILKVRRDAAPTASYAQTATNINSAYMTSTVLRTLGDRCTFVPSTQSAMKRTPITVTRPFHQRTYPQQGTYHHQQGTYHHKHGTYHHIQGTYHHQQKMTASRRIFFASTASPTCSAEMWVTAPSSPTASSSIVLAHRYATSLSTNPVPSKSLEEAVFTDRSGRPSVFWSSCKLFFVYV